jgi:hypothetical protein
VSEGVDVDVTPGFPRHELAAMTDEQATTTFDALTRLVMSFGLETAEAAVLIEARRLLEVQLRIAGRDGLARRLHEGAR